ncbi:hypothetical protein QOZ80_2BG0156850 [Eleusine coracana subsp. coracana]|nr:hypothetical protein QOZ80_2BG0156850 [Eleusine coracana subsp. coracana]
MAAVVVSVASSVPTHHHHRHCCAPAPFRPTTHSAPPPPPPPFVIHVRWTTPPPGCFKLDFDGSVLHDGSGHARATIGGVLRDCTGNIVFAFAEPTSHAPIGFVEARALIRGLELVLEMGGFITSRPLLVEGDDLTLVRLLRGESRQTRIPLPMEDDILELLGRFRGGCEVRHIFREGNQVADKLTKEAYRCPGVWINNRLVPIGVWEKAEDDRHGVVHQRLRAP